MKCSRNLFLLGVLLSLSAGNLCAHADNQGSFFAPDASICSDFTPEMFEGRLLTGSNPYETVDINQTFTLVNSYNVYVLSASDAQQVATACSTEVEKLNSANDGFNYTCGKVLAGPIARGCYQDLGTVESWGCATAQGASAEISRSPILSEVDTQKAQCEKLFDASSYIDRLKDTCDAGSSFFHPHPWSDLQKKTLNLISQHVGCK